MKYLMRKREISRSAPVSENERELSWPAVSASPSLEEAQTSGTGGVVEPEENIQSEHYSFSSGQTSQFTVQI